MKGARRPNNCFRCWHCRPVEGLRSVCVCMANVSKHVKPDLITEPYTGVCAAFFDKREYECADYQGGGSVRC